MVVCFNQKVIDDKMLDLKVENRNAGFNQLLSISAFTTFATNKAFRTADLNVHKTKNGRTSKMDVSTTSQIFS